MNIFGPFGNNNSSGEDPAFPVINELAAEFDLRDVLFRSYCGDGTDGSLVVASGEIVTLSRDSFYTTVLIQAGGTLQTQGYRLYATISVTVDPGAFLRVTVNAPSGSTIASSAGYGRSCQALTSTGSNGRQAGRLATSQGYMTNAFGGAGGLGGAVGSALGEYGMEVELPPAGTMNVLNPLGMKYRLYESFLAASKFVGGAYGGAGAGGGNTSNLGGASGTGGGVMIVVAPYITINGTASARGAAGGSSPAVANGGGGGGGGGGLLYFASLQGVSGTPTYDLQGGPGGSGVGTGTAGLPGAEGRCIDSVWA